MARKVLQSAQTTGNGVENEFKFLPRQAKVYITGSAGVSAGAIQLEEAPTPAYGGTWSPIGTPVTVVASTTKVVVLTEVMANVRARISTNVVGGTVTVELIWVRDPAT